MLTPDPVSRIGLCEGEGKFVWNCVPSADLVTGIGFILGREMIGELCVYSRLW